MLQKIVKIPQVHVINEVAKVLRNMRRQVPMIQDETQKDPKPEKVPFFFLRFSSWKVTFRQFPTFNYTWSGVSDVSIGPGSPFFENGPTSQSDPTFC